MKERTSLSEIWSEFLRKKTNFILLLFSFFAMVLMLHFTARFIVSVEQRNGFSFNDPILSLFEPLDLTWLIFSFLYFSVLLSFVLLLRNPKELVLAFLSYSFLLFLRISCMYFLPLNPPNDIILLKDPIIEYFGTDVTLTKDLFFSGHTSLMFLLFLLIHNKPAKFFLFFATLVVGLGVIFQKAHYTIDVVIAILASFCSYEWTKRILKYFKFF
ncbi:MAG: sphingomyelin synthase family protein [Ignavibacteria bacterium]|nr:sphingomyelin synthase family protein [Ignavibacteria bacterium]